MSCGDRKTRDPLMILAGERVAPDAVRRLANLLPDKQLATRLVAALDNDTTIFALTHTQCEAIILALDESAPRQLDSLRAALVRQREVRTRRRETQLRSSRQGLQSGRGGG